MKKTMITKRSLFYWPLHRFRLFQLLILGIILASLFFRVFPLEMQKRVINTAIRLKQEDLLFLYCGLYIGAVVFAGLLKFFLNVSQRYLGQKILMEIREELYEHILQLPLQFFRSTQAGTVINAMTAELNAVGVFLGNALAVPVASVLTFCTFTGYMIYLDVRLGLISLAIYPVEVFLIPYMQKRYNRLNKERVKAIRAMSNVVNESISGIHEVQGNASYRLEQRRLGRFIHELFRTMNRLFKYKFGIKFVNNLVQSMGPFILFLYGGYLAIHGHFTLGALVAFLSAYEKVYDPWKEMIEYYQEYQDAKVRYQQVMETFDVPLSHPLLPEGRDAVTLDGHIKITDLGYSITDDVKLLSNISLEILPKEQVALVGFSGSGKSTLALILGQLYDYENGSIQIDGHELSELTKADISANLGFVAQHPFIFTGTIRDNIVYSCMASELNKGETGEMLPCGAQIMEMVEDVGLKGDIIRFGLNTVIPRERCEPLVKTFLKMRQAITRHRGRELEKIIEPYDVNSFLRHTTIYENIIYGEFKYGLFALETLPRSRVFRDFLKKEGMYEPLLRIGRNLTMQTVALLRDFADDDFFLRTSPITANEFKDYEILAERLEQPGYTPSAQDEARLMLMALRFVPARHKMVSISSELQKKIVEVRHHFIQEIGKVNLHECRRAAQAMMEGGAVPEMPGGNRDFVSYCPTQYQFSHTLLDNIIFGNIKSAHAQDTSHVIEVVTGLLEEENLLREVMDIGLDFHVGSKGDRLSGGQKQKVALARVLLKDPKILIMDEATASLDNASQSKVQEMITTKLKGKCTLISVIHRLDMAPDFDKIVVLRAGRIAEAGTFDELISKQGVFYELIQGT